MFDYWNGLEIYDGNSALKSRLKKCETLRFIDSEEIEEFGDTCVGKLFTSKTLSNHIQAITLKLLRCVDIPQVLAALRFSKTIKTISFTFGNAKALQTILVRIL